MSIKDDASKAHIVVREYYKKSGKSTNKQHLANGTNWFRFLNEGKYRSQETAKNKAEKLEHAIIARGALRKKMSSDPKRGPTLMDLQGFCVGKTYEQVSDLVAAPNCHELAWLAALYVREKLKGQAAIVDILNGNHTFCLVGEGRKPNVGEKIPIPNFDNMGHWICDPWANICCHPTEFPDLFKAKMQKWKRDGKRLASNGAWVMPDNHAWVNGIMKGEKVIIG